MIAGFWWKWLGEKKREIMIDVESWNDVNDLEEREWNLEDSWRAKRYCGLRCEASMWTEDETRR